MKRFKLTKEHLKLLRHFYVDYCDWSEFGAPMINTKRPYGNSDVYDDIGKLLNIKKSIVDGEVDFTDEQYVQMKKVHDETAIALQIVLVTGKFKAGTYETSDDYSIDWKLKR